MVKKTPQHAQLLLAGLARGFHHLDLAARSAAHCPFAGPWDSPSSTLITKRRNPWILLRLGDAPVDAVGLQYLLGEFGPQSWALGEQ